MRERTLILNMVCGAVGVMIFLASPAIADTCGDDLATVQAALRGPESATISPSVLAEAEKLVREAASFCADGENVRASGKLFEAKKLLLINY